MNCTPFPFCPTAPLIHWPWGGPFTGLIALGLFILWIWTLVDVLTKESDENSNRLIWGLIVGLTYVIGAIIYLIVRRPERIKKSGNQK
ncbi:MAG: PLD nuclease N-terminal domain-containing protein [candidate division WOR-3 bacterium]|jgi:predicted membrane channel-forming protein YqfA (hemolysin III family)